MQRGSLFSGKRFRYALLAAAVVAQAIFPTGGARAAGERDGDDGTISRPLRYTPEGRGFTIINGEMWFNRPLYGPHSAFQIKGGDKPEFALAGGTMRYGVVRLILITPAGMKYLTQADKIVTHYEEGVLRYEITDAFLGDGVTLTLTAASSVADETLLLKGELSKPVQGAELAFAFGGVMDMKGRRSSPDGPTRAVASVRPLDEQAGVPLKGYLELLGVQCSGNVAAVSGNTFTVTAGKETVGGVISSGGSAKVGDGAQLKSAEGVLGSELKKMPLVTGRAAMEKPVYIAVGRNLDIGSRDGIAEKAFGEAVMYRKSQADLLMVDTPDAFINSAAAAIGSAADGVWQSPTWMHGAVSWRMALLGWRGDYIGDDTGQHDRNRAFFEYWAAKQNTADDFPTVATADPAKNLAENDGKMLHSNGSIPAKHYDMNLVYFDAMIRHLMWTGDKAFAKKMWPVIQRHLAWEKRCFDRDGLYEGYAAIWASDALQYNGGGSAHGSAYVEFQNRMAAKIATWIGEDPKPYDAEADRIAAAINKQLWLSDRGWYAEYQDAMGEKQVHPSAAVWSIYHTIDSQVPDAFQAWQSLRYVDTTIPHLAVRGKDLPKGDWAVISTSTWMPYEWSLNNVVTAESMHTALAYFEGDRSEEGFRLLKSEFLDTMYTGMTPGDLPNLSAFDVYRGESYTDFADAIGTTSRAMVEGLMGVRPNAIENELLIEPGFPVGWNHASFKMKDMNYSFAVKDGKEHWDVQSSFPVPMKLKLRLPARTLGISSVTVNGKAVQWRVLSAHVGSPQVEIVAADAADTNSVDITWSGDAVPTVDAPALVAQADTMKVTIAGVKILAIKDPQGAWKDAKIDGSSVTATNVGIVGHRTIFLQCSTGSSADDAKALTWWAPVPFESRPAYEVEAVEGTAQNNAITSVQIRNNTSTALSGSISIAFGGNTVSKDVRIDAAGVSNPIDLATSTLLPGTTPIEVTMPEGTVARKAVGAVVNWSIPVAANKSLETVDMGKVFNDHVTQIFKNEYLTPRPKTVSLQIPLQGYGDWTGPKKTYAVDDTGLRSAAKNGVFTLPNGVSFRTPSSGKNIVYTSQWDRYPKSASVPLTGHAAHAYFMLAGSTFPMESQLENGELVVRYTDGTEAKLSLKNPDNWWPIDGDYRVDGGAFRRNGPAPMRVRLKTGVAYVPGMGVADNTATDADDGDEGSGKAGAGGTATVLDMALDPHKELQSVTLHTEAWEIVMGLMGITLERVPVEGH